MSRDNSFDMVRLLAAAMVIYYHHAMMFGFSLPALDKGFAIGTIAVQTFFTISGYLIAMSFMRSNNFIEYMGKRIKRIIPAITFCSFVMVYIFASLYKSDVISYITSFDAFRNFLNISVLYGRNVPGLWNEISSHTESNGPLWTLPYEMAMYIILGVGLSFHKTWKTPAILLISCILLTILAKPQLMNVGMYYSVFSKLAEFGICFFTGSLLFMTRISWDSKPAKLSMLTISLIMLVVLNGGSDMLTLGSLSIAIIVIIVSVSLKDYVIAGRFDISYGLYIWGWPIQILVIHYIPMEQDMFLISLLLTYLIVTAVASFSWIFIEKPFLRRAPSRAPAKQYGLTD